MLKHPDLLIIKHTVFWYNTLGLYLLIELCVLIALECYVQTSNTLSKKAVPQRMLYEIDRTGHSALLRQHLIMTTIAITLVALLRLVRVACRARIRDKGNLSSICEILQAVLVITLWWGYFTVENHTTHHGAFWLGGYVLSVVLDKYFAGQCVRGDSELADQGPADEALPGPVQSDPTGPMTKNGKPDMRYSANKVRPLV
jgi:hypothetical protein